MPNLHKTSITCTTKSSYQLYVQLLISNNATSGGSYVWESYVCATAHLSYRTLSKILHMYYLTYFSCWFTVKKLGVNTQQFVDFVTSVRVLTTTQLKLQPRL